MGSLVISQNFTASKWCLIKRSYNIHISCNTAFSDTFFFLYSHSSQQNIWRALPVVKSSILHLSCVQSCFSEACSTGTVCPAVYSRSRGPDTTSRHSSPAVSVMNQWTLLPLLSVQLQPLDNVTLLAELTVCVRLVASGPLKTTWTDYFEAFRVFRLIHV